MALIVLDPGLHATVQDPGRFGYREWGVPIGGAFDGFSAALANALVGNPVDSAALELTLTGGSYRAGCDLALALAGAAADARVVAADLPDRSLAVPTSFSLRTGDRLVLGPIRGGARTYLAVKAGWQTRVVLGSRSSETRLRSGAILPALPGSTVVRRPRDPIVGSTTTEPLRIVVGPDCESYPMIDDAFWTSRRFQVDSRSDRMGLRLMGDIVTAAPPPDRLSAPVSPGAIQVAGGQLIVLGVACGTMGGYPHVAHVISADLDRLGQLRPGETIAFRRVTIDEARALDLADRRTRNALLGRIRLAASDS